MDTNTQTQQAVEQSTVEPVRRINGASGTLEVLAVLKRDLPEVWEVAEVVGHWVWITFGEVPEKSVRTALLAMGFHWNHKRRAWQHPCGHWCRHTNGEPRWKYGQVPAKELESVTV